MFETSKAQAPHAGVHHTSLRPPVGLVFKSLLRADATTALRNKYTGLMNLFLPLVIVIVDSFGKTANRLGGVGVVIGLALILGLGTSSLLGYPLTLSHDRDAGVLRRLRVAPVPGWSIITSRLAIQVMFNLVTSIIVIIVAAVLHGFTLSAGRYALFIATALLASVMFLSLGQAVAGLLRTYSAVLAVGRVLFMLLLLVGLVGYSGVLGAGMQTAALWTPVGALITLFSDVLGTAGWAANDGWAVLACLVWTAAGAFIGLRWFHWEAKV